MTHLDTSSQCFVQQPFLIFYVQHLSGGGMGRCGRGPWVAPSPFTCKDMFASQGTAEMQDTGGRCQTAAALLCNMLVCLFPLVFCLHELPKPCWELISFRHPALEAWNCRMRADSVRLRPHNVHYACLSCFAYVLPTQIEKKKGSSINFFFIV